MRLPNRIACGALLALVSLRLFAEPWPVLNTYEGDRLRRVRLPLGGIGTGTISLSGRGALLDWEIGYRPQRNHAPAGIEKPHFAIRAKGAGTAPRALLLEGPIPTDEYDGDMGSKTPNHGFPRFAKAVFRAAYPLAQLDLSDPTFPIAPHLEAFNPLVPKDVDASSFPAVLFRWRLANPTSAPLETSVLFCGPADREVEVSVPDGLGVVTRRRRVRKPTGNDHWDWNVSVDRYWRDFVRTGDLVDPPADEWPDTVEVSPFALAVRLTLAPGETKEIPFVIAWHKPERFAWNRYDSKDPADRVGNYYATKFADARAVTAEFRRRLPELERQTLAFVRSVLATKVPDVIKEAALDNLVPLRSQTCFRTADGHFFGYEGSFDSKGSCFGSCTHVWGYEHALIDLWPELAKDMTETYFSHAQVPESGRIVNRVALPLRRPQTGDRTREAPDAALSAADGQMQCIIKACENWTKLRDDAWLAGLWPKIRRAMSFCWVEGGWDADRDGVMEGCQHNTMDVDYYGPNAQMTFLYLAALKACEKMAGACGDAAFATTCRELRERGSDWIEKNLFNGAYYEQRIVPPAGKIAEGLRDAKWGARDLADPEFQLGSACLIDQLLGDFSAYAAGLGRVSDPVHGAKTLQSVLANCRRLPDDKDFNPMRSFVMGGETSLRMAWYPEDRRPRTPFPYYGETMSGFEYVVAGLLAIDGDLAAAERVVRDIRDRYDGAKRNPFDEAECGHYYIRTLAAWTVFRAFVEKAGSAEREDVGQKPQTRAFGPLPE